MRKPAFGSGDTVHVLPLGCDAIVLEVVELMVPQYVVSLAGGDPLVFPEH